VDLSVVVPCFDEEDRLRASLAPLVSYLDATGMTFEVVLVDDGSRDGTAEVMRAAAADDRRIRCMALGRNRGKGRALAEGVATTTGALVLTSDADFSAPIEELGKLRAAIAGGADIAVGSRATPGARELDQPFHRRLMGKGFNLMVQVTLLPGIWDTQCGFKLFAGDVARELFGRLRTDGFAHDVEVLHLARRSGRRVCEVPVRWINSSTSRVQPLRHSREMLMDLLRIRFGR
jgi:dolichyl-phosphate beta-glucosyltransferase